MHNQKLEGIKKRSKYIWYEDGKKSSKFFLNLEKNLALQNQIRLLKIGEKKVKIKVKYCKNCISFMKSYFLKRFLNFNEVIAHYLKDISLPKLTKEQGEQCEANIIENEVKDAPKNMVCNKTPGNDKTFHKTF